MVEMTNGDVNANGAAPLQQMLEAYRAMVPVKDVVAFMKQHFVGKEEDDHWSSLTVQVRTTREHLNDWMDGEMTHPLPMNAAICFDVCGVQETILESVVRDPVCDKFPPHKSYVYRFLKSYMSEIENVGAEAHDELVAELLGFVVHGRLGQTVLSAEDLHHVSFTIPTTTAIKFAQCENSQGLVVTCRVASVFNEVGMKIWEAGWYLAEYIITHPDVFTNQTVLELGAGVGFSGLVLAGVAKPKHVLLSDYGSSVMQNLRYNAEINTPHFQCPVDVLTLDWDTWDLSEENTNGEEALRPDILLAGDCVYDVASFPSLVRVLQVFLGSSSERKAIFASTIRNQKTFQAFLDQLKAFAIAYEDITTASLVTMGMQMFPYDNRSQIRLCVLTRA